MFWIESIKQKPELIKNENYSANVWGWDGKEIRIVAWVIEPGEGGFWGNAYGDIWGEADVDDDYHIINWAPIAIPLPPQK